jgi:phosphoribosylamine--glycine ligase
MSTRVERTDVLVIGGGAREHAYAASLARSPRVGRVYVAPGNGGTAEIAENVAIGVDDFRSLVRFAKAKRALTVVGPEAPLVAGIRDVFDAEGLPLAGVSKETARLEGSKVFAAQVNRELGIPQPQSEEFDDLDHAVAALRSGRFARPVIKADGLAAGKGVVLPDTLDEAEDAARAMLRDGIFGEAGRRIVIQERLEGVEFSLMALVDGRDFQTFPIAQDHKRIGEGDTGPNTGGMGACAPVPPSVIPPSVVRRAEAAILRPLIDGMARRGAPIQGILFAGLMATAGGPQVIEYNVRGGDPEIPTVLPLLASDLFAHFRAVTEGSLARCPMRFWPGFALNIVLASAGYPGAYDSGKPISGLDQVRDALVFHAGTTRLPDGALATSGGRVLDVVAVADDLAAAQRAALAAADAITFEGKQFRCDIGARALAAEPAR